MIITAEFNHENVVRRVVGVKFTKDGAGFTWSHEFVKAVDLKTGDVFTSLYGIKASYMRIVDKAKLANCVRFTVSWPTNPCSTTNEDRSGTIRVAAEVICRFKLKGRTVHDSDPSCVHDALDSRAMNMAIKSCHEEAQARLATGNAFGAKSYQIVIKHITESILCTDYLKTGKLPKPHSTKSSKKTGKASKTPSAPSTRSAALKACSTARSKKKT